MTNLERVVRELTTEINGQYPRPWMTSLPDPSRAQVFVVGYNPARAYPAAQLKHERHIDALFNRNGETCWELYTEITKQSPTSGNIKMLTEKLGAAGVTSVLVTNVVCYSTSRKKDLAAPQHVGGKSRGQEIFRSLVREIAPKVMIVHGAGAIDEFNRTFRSEVQLPGPSETSGVFPAIALSTGTRVFAIPSLGLPGYQTWPKGNGFCKWADPYLDELAVRVARICAA